MLVIDFNEHDAGKPHWLSVVAEQRRRERLGIYRIVTLARGGQIQDLGRLARLFERLVGREPSTEEIADIRVALGLTDTSQ